MTAISHKDKSCSWESVAENKKLWHQFACWIDGNLESTYHSPNHGNYKDPTNELFFIILSKKTPPDHYVPIFKKLKRECGSWEGLIKIQQGKIEDILQPLGISHLRAKQIKELPKSFSKILAKLHFNH
jgi:endonuclease III